MRCARLSAAFCPSYMHLQVSLLGPFSLTGTVSVSPKLMPKGQTAEKLYRDFARRWPKCDFSKVAVKHLRALKWIDCSKVALDRHNAAIEEFGPHVPERQRNKYYEAWHDYVRQGFTAYYMGEHLTILFLRLWTRYFSSANSTFAFNMATRS